MHESWFNTSHITLTHSGEADSNRCSLANMFKHLGLAVTTDVMSHLKVAKSPCITGEKKTFICLY